MRLNFTKMQGLGNDFIVIDALTEAIDLSVDQIRFMADRHFGIGFDQCLLLEPATSDNADLRYRIFNADGGEVEQCGNGARCVAVYLRDQRQMTQAEIVAETANGLIVLACQNDGQVTVNMGTPKFDPASLPLLADEVSLQYEVEINDQTLRFVAISMGNPHAVIQVENTDTAPVENVGSILGSHSLFPEKVNVGFMQVISSDHIRLRVYERGAGETLACGTGACAAAVSGIRQGILTSPVRVELPGGELQIAWKENSEPVMMTGSASHVFAGTIQL